MPFYIIMCVLFYETHRSRIRTNSQLRSILGKNELVKLELFPLALEMFCDHLYHYLYKRVICIFMNVYLYYIVSYLYSLRSIHICIYVDILNVLLCYCRNVFYSKQIFIKKCICCLTLNR